jgi:hypothetical protein
MQKPNPAGRPMARLRRPLVCHTSDLALDHGAPMMPDDPPLGQRWRMRNIEEEGGLRLDVYRSLGLI